MTPGTELIGLVWSNLKRMRGRAVMTAMGVLIGTAAIVVLISLAFGVQQSAVGDLSAFGPVNQITLLPGATLQALGAGSSGESAELTTSVLEDISRMEGVTAVTPRVSVNAPTTLRMNRLVGSGSLVGIDPRAVDDMGLDLAEGTDRLERGAVRRGSGEGHRT